MKKTLKRNLIFFAIFSIIEYLFFHAIYLTVGVGEIAMHIIRFSITVFPPLVGIGVLKSGVNTRCNLLDMAYIYICRLPFFFLYIYVSAHELFRMTTVKIVLYAILFSLGVAIIYYLLSLLVYYIIRRKIEKAKRDIDTLLPIKITDFKNPVVLGLLTLPLIIFAIEFGYEIYLTVTYLIRYYRDYRLTEIIYLVFQYLFILIKLMATMLLSKLLINMGLLKNDESESK